jgi:hypothetical protein
LNAGDSTPAYYLAAELKPAASLAKAPLTGFGGGAKLKVTTKADSAKVKNTGIALELTIGSWSVQAIGHIPAVLRIERENGALVHQETGELSKFAFG